MPNLVITIADIEKLTPAQKDVLGRIAMNEDRGHNPRVVGKLLSLGLIEAREETLPQGVRGLRRLGGPPVTVTLYDVPTHVHVVWCEWCASLPECELQKELDELERTDPAVAAAAQNYDKTVQALIKKPRGSK